MALSTLAELDPTGTLSAATSAVGLVSNILKAVPTVKNAASTNTGPSNLQRSTTTPGAVNATLKKDPERERRAYETVNYVLREFGSRLVSPPPPVASVHTLIL